MREHGFGLLLTPDRPELRKGFNLLAIDNGAWGCFQRGAEWLPEPWQRITVEHGAIARFTVLPDVVCGGASSLVLSLAWMPWALDHCAKVLIPVQPGMVAADLRPHLSDRVGLFVGGDTEWKERSLPEWGALARETNCWLHVGRVNSARRIHLCALSGADSFDGTSATRFAVTTPRIDMARRQTAMELFT